MKPLHLLALVSQFLVLPGLLQAGYVYELESDDAGSAEPRNFRILVQDGKLRMEVPNVQDEEASIVYDAADGSFTAIDHRRRQYTRFTSDSMKQLADTMADARRQMEETLQNVPASQRAMVEKMMGSMMPEETAPPEVSVRETGEKKQVAGYSAEKVSVFSDGVKVSDLWVAPFNEVEGSREVMGAFAGLSSFMKDLMQALPSGLAGQESSAYIQAMGAIDGFPVASAMFEGGEQVASSLLKNIQSKELESSEFAPPSGYKEQKIEMPSFGR